MGDDHPPPWIVDGVDLRQEFPRMLLGPANREGPNHLPTTMEEEVAATAAPTGVATEKSSSTCGIIGEEDDVIIMAVAGTGSQIGSSLLLRLVTVTSKASRCISAMLF